MAVPYSRTAGWAHAVERSPARESLAGRCATVLLLMATPLPAQVAPPDAPLVLPRLTQVEAAVDAHGHPVRGDRAGDEDAWKALSPLPLVVRSPSYGAAPTERSDIRVAHTHDMLHIRAVLYDREPARIRANSLYRDRMSGDDVLGVLIDAHADHENALWFWTTPAGVRGDAAILGDGRSANVAWDGVCDAVATRSDSGWTAELRIPLATIGARVVRDTMTIGLTVYRYIARRNEVQMFPSVPTDWDFLRPSRAQRVILAGVRSRRPLHITPWILVGLAGSSEPAAATPGLEHSAGADVRYRITPGMVLDFTINTDFAQVEADDAQVNLTRFPLSFPERRRFFLEAAGVFEFGTGGDGRLFYSRRIGLVDGAPVPIAGGVRLAGRAGAWDVGLLQVRTRAAPGVPAENFGVLRARRPILNPQSHAGLMATVRLAADGAANTALGLDALLHLSGDDYVTVRAAHTVDRPAFDLTALHAVGSDIAGELPIAVRSADRTGARRSFDPAVGRITWERRRSAGVRYAATAGWTGQRYTPGIGFAARTGVTDAAAALAWAWFPAGPGRVQRIDPVQFSAEMLVRHEDATVESASLEYNFDIALRSGLETSADVELSFEDVPMFDLPDGTTVSAGRYTLTTLEAGVESPTGRLLRGEVDAAIGTFYDGWRAALESRLTWNASRHVELAAEHTFDAVRFPVRHRGFDSHVLRLRAGFARDTRASATVFAQYSSLNGDHGMNLRLRYNFAEGHDLWLVLDGVSQGSPATARRSLVMKYARMLIR